jgi:hypothetical protein
MRQGLRCRQCMHTIPVQSGRLEGWVLPVKDQLAWTEEARIPPNKILLYRIGWQPLMSENAQASRWCSVEYPQSNNSPKPRSRVMLEQRTMYVTLNYGMEIRVNQLASCIWFILGYFKEHGFVMVYDHKFEKPKYWFRVMNNCPLYKNCSNFNIGNKNTAID